MGKTREIAGVPFYVVVCLRSSIKPYLRHVFRSDTFPGTSCQATFGQSLRDGCAERGFPGTSCQATFGQSLRDGPAGRGFPGISCQATFGQSLRDKIRYLISGKSMASRPRIASCRCANILKTLFSHQPIRFRNRSWCARAHRHNKCK